MNTLDAPYLLDEADSLFARDVLNVQATTAGAIVKRTGFTTLASPSNIFTSLAPLESTATPFLLGADASAIYSVKADGTVTSLKTGLSNNRWEWVSAPIVSAQGPAFGINGSDTPQRWDGIAGSTSNWTNASGGVAVPNGRYMALFRNQVFISGVASNPSRVYWSAIADATNWDPASLTGAGFADFDPNDGSAITGIGVIGNYVVVAKPRKIWVIYDVANAGIRPISNEVGIASHRSIAVGPEGMYFLAEDRGVFLFTGTKLTPISDKIRPTLDSITGSLRSQAAGAYFGAHYYLSVSLNGSSNDTILDFDATLGSWWKHSQGSNQFATWHPSGSANVAGLYSAKATAARVDQCFTPGVFTDNGAAMTWVWRGPWQSPTFYRRRKFPTPYFRKRLRQVRFDGQGTVDFSLAKDFAGLETLIAANTLQSTIGGTYGAADGTVYGAADGTVFGVPSVQRARFYSLGVANAFSIVFGATSATPDEVFEYVLLVLDRKDSL